MPHSRAASQASTTRHAGGATNQPTRRASVNQPLATAAGFCLWVLAFASCLLACPDHLQVTSLSTLSPLLRAKAFWPEHSSHMTDSTNSSSTKRDPTARHPATNIQKTRKHTAPQPSTPHTAPLNKVVLNTELARPRGHTPYSGGSSGCHVWPSIRNTRAVKTHAGTAQHCPAKGRACLPFATHLRCGTQQHCLRAHESKPSRPA
jgi:hypothetical protein